MYEVKGFGVLRFAAFFFIASKSYASGTENSCQVSVQVRDFMPRTCYSEYSESSCNDICVAAEPSMEPSCFRKIELPCGIKQELKASALGYQNRNGHEWFHVTDLMNHTALIEQYYVLQQSLYGELYKDFVNPADVAGFSPASDSLRKVNFRLNTISSTRSVAAGLSHAALYRRYEYGLLLEEKLNAHLAKVNANINQFDLMSAFEKENLKVEINQLVDSQTRLWKILKKYDASTILSSRVRIINRRLTALNDSLILIPFVQQQAFINKTQVLNAYFDVSFRQCETTTCFNALDASAVVIDTDYDKKLTYFELYLEQLNNEASLLSNAYSSDYHPVDPAFVRMPTFAGFVTEHYQDMRAQGTELSLKKLATAINVAYLAKNVDGRRLSQKLAQTADSTIDGFSSIAPFNEQHTLLCKEYTRINPQLSQFQQESFTLGHEANELIATLIDFGLDSEQLARLEWIITRLNVLAAQSIQIANLNITEVDRYQSVVWKLDQADNFFTNNGNIEIEYLEYDGLYWTPNMLPSIPEIMPSIVNISTPESTLFPTGSASAGSMNVLQMLIKQNPFSACSENNNELQLIIKAESPNGQVKRHILRATLEQL
ncbi:MULTISPECIES: hypothetical protein [Pseudoalteromonas]|uniref:Uncharacterized protein n=1 Tax=Pseudoalteromonas piscicida TaxID=43662 RepID=A0ABN5CB55_PSEO7|nr:MULTISPECIES: hypothetical protein [Pseudoalteromonas]ATD05886.1 hypothetical protein PPIS_a0622 [Pseudoalteromonas piscicida]MCO7201279.1 hypothetical protein [Pseudoalteromonas sp. OANN1]WPU32670.1 hypothetical protein SIO17_02640 [Pseudoalteromonas piscicida]